MIPFYRYVEMGVFTILQCIPFLLAVYPFRKNIRFSKPVAAALLLAAVVVQFCLGLLTGFFPIREEAISLLRTGIFAGFCFLIIKDQLGRLSFVLLVFSTLANLLTVCSKHIEGLIFGDMALEPYRWSLCLCLGIMHLLITPPITLYLRKYAASIHIQTRCWQYLWIIPATFYVAWFYHLYLSGKVSPAAVLEVHHVIYLLLMNLGAFIIYHTVVLLLLEQQKNQQLAHDNHLLSLSSMQHQHLQQRINEARQAKHDVHHHTLLIREYLRDGNLQALESYLDAYAASLPETQALVHCQHYATNILLGHFAQQAADNHIPMDIFVQLPEKIHLPETTLSVVLGNLLENAIEASGKVPSDRRKITVRGKASMGSVLFEITNTFEGDLRQNKHGTYQTTKSGPGHGLGLESVSQLAASLGGVLELDTDNGVFRASVLLPEVNS